MRHHDTEPPPVGTGGGSRSGGGSPGPRRSGEVDYGVQGELTIQLTSAAHEVAESNEFGPPLLAI